MVKIRLMRVGRLHQISFRIVAADEQAQRDGKTLEMLGVYNPRAKAAAQITLKLDRVEHWMTLGAQPTPTVVKILKRQGVKVADIRARMKAAGQAAKAAKTAKA